MKKYNLLQLAALLVLCCAMFGCGKDDGSSNGGGLGSIFGTLTDFATGHPVANANVQLLMSGNATLHASITGNDGQYEILDVPCGSYSIKITKVGYSDLIDNNPVVIEKDKKTKRDAQIKKLPSSLHIYDNEGNEISELDFGANEGMTQKTFNIFNGGSQRLDYTITKTANWISNISQSTGTIEVGVTCPIVIAIDRNLLAEGNNATTLLITSSADGGKELVVKAKKGGSDSDLVVELFSANLMVQKEDLGIVDWNSAKLLCDNSIVAEFNDWRLPTKEELMTLYSNRELIGGFVNDKYWSSSEQSDFRYYVDFSNGGLDYWWGTNQCHVRAVRTISH